MAENKCPGCVGMSIAVTTDEDGKRTWAPIVIHESDFCEVHKPPVVGAKG